MQLVGLKGIHWTQVFPLGGAETSVGREAGNSIVCDSDSRVSRRHARFIQMGPTYGVEDLGSSNGTFVNGVRISAPTALNPGDEITIGGQSFRFEATAAPQPYAAPPTVPQPPRPREVSRGEQAQQQGWNRGTERIYDAPTSNLDGCAFPQINLPDLSGCLRILMLLLIAMVILAVIAGLLMLVGAGIGGLAGGGAAAGASATGGGQGGSGGSSGTTNTTTNGGAQDQPGTSAKGIYIVSVRIAQVRGRSRALVSWQNLTDNPVHKIIGTVTTEDAAGNPISTQKEVVIYDGKAVGSGVEHDDSETAGDGFEPPARGNPVSAKIIVTRYE